MADSTTIASASDTKTGKLLLFEWIIIASFVFLGAYIGFWLAPGTKYWDDLLYIHTAWSMEKVPIILNRYFIVYSLGLINLFSAGDPIVGAKYYGAFTGTIIVALVYLNARILAKTHQIFSGLVATLFLISFVYFTEDFGAVLADFAVTMLILVGILAFVCYYSHIEGRSCSYYSA